MGKTEARVFSVDNASGSCCAVSKAGPSIRPEGIVMKTPCWILPFLLCSLGGTSSCSRKNSKPQASQTSTASLVALQKQAGIALPTDAVVLTQGDGGGRDPAYSFFTWTVFSPTSGSIPLDQYSIASSYIKDSSPDTILVDFVESMLSGTKIGMAVMSASGRWSANGFDFQASLVSCTNGDYLVVSRFAQR